MKKLLCALSVAIFALAFTACVSGAPDTNGAGGSGNATTTTSTDTGGSNTGGAGGDVNVCYVWAEDPFAVSDPTCEICLCSVIPNETDPAYCQSQLEFGRDICPAGGNTCEPGISRCGYHLPPGQAYEWPDATCKLFVQGDTWTDENFNANTWGTEPPHYDENGQLQVNGYRMSGRVLYQYMFSPQAEAGSGTCTFDQHCTTLTCVSVPSGTTRMFWWQNHPGL